VKNSLLDSSHSKIKKEEEEGLESSLIRTVAKCNVCKLSDNWLGRYSLVPEIKNGKLWLLQYITSEMRTFA
jgi:hypothetical protein